jgi:hypothetical protein
MYDATGTPATTPCDRALPVMDSLLLSKGLLLDYEYLVLKDYLRTVHISNRSRTRY